ncbi:TRAP transporter large permease [Cupriavidus taiwanensis]|uniref:Putative TRAP-type C4-dicarboxylate transport system, large membrane protein component n=1 Tax=Cupriavidus taiwanensis TaxID=164546 RepID=A0A7Z7JCW1_9BURK|nr:TRAP transporter large permease subunit [Cupriavidus taiwanensis]SOZ09970.1 putative TRAP-type C4-dicarboxylate transport system, large membrane protein component [Cupriavidus taiwanensis]SOZ12139.1 putative TRAP-type C4-dicarboxylate transport system, large membrane protein component [Cupriavidus taiwanensis]SOZ43444.1 putative TRAP-type C4-dicarboxylate transport system, large membrane protein component [Cupriavidus taiwanensis]SPC22686.1 putative TRAP-type C4-dicarboxylate transport syste
MRKELWFGVSLMVLIVGAVAWFMPAPADWTNGHLGLLMLALIVVAIMLGFPTAFTLMGMGVLFSWLAYRHANPEIAVQQTLDLMVQRAYAVMTNDVLISIPLFVFMGYLVERSNLIEKLFRSLHLALAWIPGSLAVATLVTCAIFATATGIVGAVVTLMGLLAFPAMLRAGYSTSMSAGAVTAGGCLGILIPPSVLLIVYGATAGVSVVQLYAGAFFPGLMLTGLYIVYIVLLAKVKPALAPPLPASERVVPLPPVARALEARGATHALPALGAGLMRALKGPRNAEVPSAVFARQLGIVLLPALVTALVMGTIYSAVTAPAASVTAESPLSLGGAEESSTAVDDLAAPPSEEAAAPAAAAPATPAAPSAPATPAAGAADASPATTPAAATVSAPRWFWITLAVVGLVLVYFYWRFSFARVEIFKMLLTSFFPLALLILAVLGSIVFGLATPTEAAAVGSLGGALLAAAYRQLTFGVLKESVLLTAKTSAMVCWLFVGSSIFSAAFALLGGQALVEQWVLSLDLSPVQFMILAQIIIFLLGWPLEWTEIIIIFMPIFIPLLDNFGIDPLFFGLLVALNLQTAFLSPPVAMAAFYLKGVAPPHVTLNQIFLGMLPFMGIQLIALVLLYVFPGIGLWLPTVLYR